MYIVANHTIANAAKFWEDAKKATIPPALKLHCVFPGTDGTRGTCLWEAQSVDAVRQFLDPLTSGTSTNEYMAVEAGNAIGLPR